MLKWLLGVLFVGAGFVLSAAEPAAATADADISALKKLEENLPRDESQAGKIAELQVGWIRLIESGELKSGDDYFRAAKVGRVIADSFRFARVQHELVLTAIALGSQDAASLLMPGWDALMQNLGRPVRMETTSELVQMVELSFVEVALAPVIVRDIWANPGGGRARAKEATDHAEITQLADDDQAARKNNGLDGGGPMHVAVKKDRLRESRVREIIEAGGLRTANDFARAALVLQHGGHFDSYRLAHELAVTALLLGDNDLGRWLVAATYDRMLESVGHLQRYGTQSTGPIVGAKDPGSPILNDVDTTGINDTQRLALGCKRAMGR
jgi:hypothetical protein